MEVLLAIVVVAAVALALRQYRKLVKKLHGFVAENAWLQKRKREAENKEDNQNKKTERLARNRPLAMHALFLGPTSAGKTELHRQLVVDTDLEEEIMRTAHIEGPTRLMIGARKHDGRVLVFHAWDTAGENQDTVYEQLFDTGCFGCGETEGDDPVMGQDEVIEGAVCILVLDVMDSTGTEEFLRTKARPILQRGVQQKKIRFIQVFLTHKDKVDDEFNLKVFEKMVRRELNRAILREHGEFKDLMFGSATRGDKITELRKNLLGLFPEPGNQQTEPARAPKPMQGDAR